MPRSRTFKRDSIFIIEDNPDHWTVIQTALSQVLPDVKQAWTTGFNSSIDYLEECIRNYQNLPSFILLDLYLPNRERGLEVLQHIKNAGSRYHQVPVVILTYSLERTDIETMYQAGCTSYLAKPTTLEGWQQLLHMVKTYWWEVATRPDHVF